MLRKSNHKIGVPVLETSIFLIALLIRLIHNRFIMDSPLYYFPLGGHVPYLALAEKIAAGHILPFDAPFSLNSPLYPYLTAFIYSIFGTGQLLVVRHFGILLDSFTCLMITILAQRHFGRIAGMVAGFVAVFYGPMIFYSAELVVVPYTLFFITLGILLLDDDSSKWKYLLAGSLFGIAVLTRPNLLILAIMVISVPFVLKRENRKLKAMLLAIGVAIAISPLTGANYIKSGHFVLLTTSAGHNFYIGHNPGSKAGYTLPEKLDGDIFANMKKLAEKVEGHELEDSEVSSFFIKKAFKNIIHYPFREIRNTAKKALASVNYFEATTYANYYFQKELSPILNHSIGFSLLFPLAIMGIIFHYNRYHILIPIIASFLTILLFFYISRLRMTMVPFLIIFAGGATSTIFSFVGEKHYFKWMMSLFCMIGIFLLSCLHLVKIDTSNEWNKVGIVLRIQKRYTEAEDAFIHATQENPLNPNTYLNLGVLYEKLGYTKQSKEMYNIGRNMKTKKIENSDLLENLRLK